MTKQKSSGLVNKMAEKGVLFQVHGENVATGLRHAHPFEGGTELTESYSIESADHLGGRYLAPFTGIHGWYWQNRTLERVRLTLDASGKMTGSKVFDQSGEHDRALNSTTE